MIAFEVRINGKKRFVAGGDAYQSLIASLVLVRQGSAKAPDCSLLLTTAAVKTEDPPVSAYWPASTVRVGDTVQIRVVDAAAVDAPKRVEP